MKREELVRYLDTFFSVSSIADRSDNGLQIEGAGEVLKVGFAVDYCLASAEAAAESRCQMLICHHGFLWGASVPLRGMEYRRVKRVFESGLSLYGVHLPLDMHPEVGNNVQIARLLSMETEGEFPVDGGRFRGVLASLKEPVSPEVLKKEFDRIFRTDSLMVRGKKDAVQKAAVVSGGGASALAQIVDQGLDVDVYITGEPSHSQYHYAAESGVTVLYGGHYATETAGLKALSEHLESRFDLETVFLDLPTGL